MAGQRNGDLATALMNAPVGLTAMRIFLWLMSVGAALGLLMLLVLRPSLVSTSESSRPSESATSTMHQSRDLAGTESQEMGAVCSFPLSDMETSSNGG